MSVEEKMNWTWKKNGKMEFCVFAQQKQLNFDEKVLIGKGQHVEHH